MAEYILKRNDRLRELLKKAGLFELLGSNSGNESIVVQRNSGLKFPFKIWTKRTFTIQISVIGIWLILLVYIHFKFSDLWIFTFHLPISGMFILFIPVVVLTLISPRFFGQKRYENINTLRELVDQIYQINKVMIKSDDFAWLNRELKDYINRESP